MDRIRLDLAETKAAPQRIVIGEQTGDLEPQPFAIGEIHEPNGAPPDLVLVGGADAAFRRADPGILAPAFPYAVELAMQRKDQWRVLGDAQIVRGDGNAL